MRGVRWSAEHGGSGAMYNRGCRCEPCKARHRERMTEGNKRRWAQRVTGANGDWFAASVLDHGTSSAYTNWGCRCDPCRGAATRRNREWRETHPRVPTKST